MPVCLSPAGSRLALILDLLCRAVAARAAQKPAMAPLMLRLWSYLRRAARRFAAIADRPPVPPRARAAAAAAAAAAARANTPHAPRLPRGFAWLVRAVPGSANFASQLQHLLADPEMTTLLANPAAGRILRPLCQMLGLRPGPDLPPALFPPRAPRATPPCSVPPCYVPPCSVPTAAPRATPAATPASWRGPGVWSHALT